MLKVAIDGFAYKDSLILKEIAFTLPAGEHLAVLGESGCGKSTLLHLIYGLLPLEQTSLSWKGETLLGPSHHLVPGEPFMKLVAQEPNVMPFTTVEENVGDFLSGQSFPEETQRIEELLKVVELSEYRNVLVKTLSGGQKQRVALARALAKKPELLLLDEPFSHIDTFRKNKLRRQLYQYLKKNTISCITATHDAQEALAFSDRILMLRQGTIEVLATPEHLYHNVANAYQAGFFDEVTVLPETHYPNAVKRVLLPNDWAVTAERTPYKVQVLRSYFRGTDYLIEAVLEELPVYFSHMEALEPSEVYLKFR
ncbi:ABC transporter ATP-binding protein [Altibacter sp. HG106]|uniref:ABC transporter ATP-binding protein n=1 Tax=Altibacter sp. HG106 TaxID=3023937 RepID=UPI002350AB2B|nr:ATP-binding cassette domain-containing protein [Altibacter sp. HG106]MDC7994941.1 ATP-binding cassette domain-containing protein [Altibacter sp. HG106]